MSAIQLEFNIENKTSSEMEIHYMQKQLCEMNESMGKVRRKLFSEITELKKMISDIQKENTMLKSKEPIEWDYNKPEYLFDISEKVVAFN